MLKACGRSTEHVGRALSGFKRRHPDLSTEVHKALAERAGKVERVNGLPRNAFRGGCTQSCDRAVERMSQSGGCGFTCLLCSVWLAFR